MNWTRYSPYLINIHRIGTHFRKRDVKLNGRKTFVCDTFLANDERFLSTYDT